MPKTDKEAEAEPDGRETALAERANKLRKELADAERHIREYRDGDPR